MQNPAHVECNKIWKPLMAQVMCPVFYKSFSLTGLEYIKIQLSDTRIKDRSLYLALSEMVSNCEVIIGERE